MPKKQAFIDKSGVKFVENFQKNQKIKKFPSRTEIRYLTAFMQKSHRIRILPGDEVSLELSPYDLDKGRITYRHNPKRSSYNNNFGKKS